MLNERFVYVCQSVKNISGRLGVQAPVILTVLMLLSLMSLIVLVDDTITSTIKISGITALSLTNLKRQTSKSHETQAPYGAD